MRRFDLKKSVKDFLFDERGTVSRKKVIKIGVYAALASLVGSNVSAFEQAPKQVKCDFNAIAKPYTGYTLLYGEWKDPKTGSVNGTELVQQVDALKCWGEHVFNGKSSVIEDDKVTCTAILHQNQLSLNTAKSNELKASHAHIIKKPTSTVTRYKDWITGSTGGDCNGDGGGTTDSSVSS